MSAFDYGTLEAAGFQKVTIEYSGSNDEGYINSIEPDHLPPGVEIAHDLYRTIEEAAYEILAENFGGWEINEGSQGTITIDVKARKATIEHGENITQVKEQTLEVS